MTVLSTDFGSIDVFGRLRWEKDLLIPAVRPVDFELESLRLIILWNRDESAFGSPNLSEAWPLFVLIACWNNFSSSTSISDFFSVSDTEVVRDELDSDLRCITLVPRLSGRDRSLDFRRRWDLKKGHVYNAHVHEV